MKHTHIHRHTHTHTHSHTHKHIITTRITMTSADLHNHKLSFQLPYSAIVCGFTYLSHWASSWRINKWLTLSATIWKKDLNQSWVIIEFRPNLCNINITCVTWYPLHQHCFLFVCLFFGGKIMCNRVTTCADFFFVVFNSCQIMETPLMLYTSTSIRPLILYLINTKKLES